MFSITLRAARINRGLTQVEAAKALGIQKKTLISWENNRTYPSAEQYLKLCRLYRCPVDGIFLPF